MSPIKFHPVPPLTTTRLQLRGLKEEDFADVLHLRSDPVINRYILRTKVQDESAVREYFALIDAGHRKNENIVWAITDRESEELLGTICLWNFSEDRKTAELGYDMKVAYHGKGIMSEALQVVLTFGSKSLGLDAIEAFTHHENTASIRLLERNGFAHQPERVDEGFPHNWIYRKEKR